MATAAGRMRGINQDLWKLQRALAAEGTLSYAVAQRVMASLSALLAEVEEMRAARLLAGEAPGLREAVAEYESRLRSLRVPLARLELYLRTERESLSAALNQAGSAQVWTSVQRLTYSEK